MPAPTLPTLQGTGRPGQVNSRWRPPPPVWLSTVRGRSVAKLSALDAAAAVLAAVDEPMGSKELVEQMLADGLWQTGGKTPANTLYAAILREISKKGDASRFRKVGRGRFAMADQA